MFTAFFSASSLCFLRSVRAKKCHFQPFLAVFLIRFSSPTTTSTEILTVSFSSQIFFDKNAPMIKKQWPLDVARASSPASSGTVPVPGPLRGSVLDVGRSMFPIFQFWRLLETFGDFWSRFFFEDPPKPLAGTIIPGPPSNTELSTLLLMNPAKPHLISVNHAQSKRITPRPLDSRPSPLFRFADLCGFLRIFAMIFFKFQSAGHSRSLIYQNLPSPNAFHSFSIDAIH